MYDVTLTEYAATWRGTNDPAIYGPQWWREVRLAHALGRGVSPRVIATLPAENAAYLRRTAPYAATATPN